MGKAKKCTLVNFDNALALGYVEQTEICSFEGFSFKRLPTVDVNGSYLVERGWDIGPQKVVLISANDVMVGVCGGVFFDSNSFYISAATWFHESVEKDPRKFAYILGQYGLGVNGAGEVFCPDQNDSIPRLSGEYFVFSNGTEDAYTHFVIDLLPSLYVWQQLPSPRPLLLMSDAVFEQRRDLLHMFGVTRADVFLKKQGERVMVERVYMTNHPRYYYSDILNYYKAAVDNYLALVKSRRILKLPSKKIYLARYDRFAWDRYMLNEDDLICELRRRGFDILVPSQMSIEEQFSCYESADIIVAQYGGALFNFLLGLRFKKIVAICSEEYHRYQLDETNHVSQHQIIKVLATAISARSDPNNSPIIIPVAQVLGAVDCLESNP